MTTSTEKKGALYFLTEQTCCLAQSQGTDGKDFRSCREAAEHLTGGDADAMRAFDERTGAVERDLTGLKDYDTDEYEGKRNDVRAAVAELTNLGTSEGTPVEKRGVLTEVADLIAGFYGMDLDVDANPA